MDIRHNEPTRKGNVHDLAIWPQKHVYVKFRDVLTMQEILTSTNGQGEFCHTNGEISTVRIEAAGLDMRRVRIATFPSEMPDRVIRMFLSRYGEVKELHEKSRSRAY